MAQKFVNNWSSTIADVGGIDDMATTLDVQSGDGAALAAATGGDIIKLTLDADPADEDAVKEIIHVTGVSTDTLTVVRGQEGTAAVSWAQGSLIQARLTKASLENTVRYDEGFSATVNANDQVFQKPEIKDYAETRNSDTGVTGTKTIDLENGNVHEHTLTGSVTYTFSNPPASGKAGGFTLIVKQDGTGGRVITWPASVKWPNNSAPTPVTTANLETVYEFMTTDGGTRWRGFMAGTGIPA